MERENRTRAGGREAEKLSAYGRGRTAHNEQKIKEKYNIHYLTYYRFRQTLRAPTGETFFKYFVFKKIFCFSFLLVMPRATALGGAKDS